ncbi:type III-B CRISPR module RAMP protein Cmr4 [Anoxybacter fermentans]|uniref:Type III-B CRISPR module RAMP protein Cmr4 n=1 Tax=Anoxybacter fermentans TaxID=1323375 RepID=A0A3S9SUJ6_9FIRM|nr:type III-B CRISPR module RAMP protein Cmr4 [Anoxybacter fermentans]AZR71956.1 type III-B CRISPR module RAMP protein Cmr4 [Anoxybacter fermentans]
MEIRKYLGKALDPIHIGAGGYRLGRVDNTIVREPATDVPKIPGTSLAGAIREYATFYLQEKDEKCKNQNDEGEKRRCAEEKAKEYFGDEKRQGMLRFYDAQILFFPVSSINGTVWITTKDLIKYWLGDIKNSDGEEIKIPRDIEDEAYIIRWVNDKKPDKLNLGWLLLVVGSQFNDDNSEIITLPLELKDFIKKIVLVSDKLFSHIVNDNLEVRTSVRIDSTTGTAAEGALFTYEAIPRGTVFGFEIIEDKRRGEKNEVDGMIKAAFKYLKLLGVGGMGTRGFGRLEILWPPVDSEKKIEKREGEGDND